MPSPHATQPRRIHSALIHVGEAFPTEPAPSLAECPSAWCPGWGTGGLGFSRRAAAHSLVFSDVPWVPDVRDEE